MGCGNEKIIKGDFFTFGPEKGERERELDRGDWEEQVLQRKVRT